MINAVAQRMAIVRRTLTAAQRDAEEHFVGRVGERVRRFSEEAGGSGNQSGDELRDGNDDVPLLCPGCEPLPGAILSCSKTFFQPLENFYSLWKIFRDSRTFLQLLQKFSRPSGRVTDAKTLL